MGCKFEPTNGEPVLYFKDRSEAIQFFMKNPEYQSQLTTSEPGFYYNGPTEVLEPNTKDLGELISQIEAAKLFKKLLPAADVRDLAFLGSLSDKGRYYKGVIQLANTGKINENVLRHEVFHKIFNEYLTEDERQTYVNAAKEIWPTATPKIAEELIARDFQTYRNKPESISLKIAKILRKILNLFNLVNNTPQQTLNDLYRQINKSKYKKVVDNGYLDTAVKNYNGIKKDFQSTNAYKKALSTLDLDIYNRSKIAQIEQLNSKNINSVLTDTLGKRNAILILPYLYREKINTLTKELSKDSTDATMKLSIEDSIDNLNNILKNYDKLAKELYPQEFSSVEDGVIAVMRSDANDEVAIKNHTEVKQFPEVVEDPEVNEDILTDSSDREDSGLIFANEIANNNQKDAETTVNDDVRWFLSHIPDGKGGFFRERNVFPVAIKLISKINFNSPLSNQNPSTFTKGRKLDSAVAAELQKLFEYIDPTLADKANPNYTFLDGQFAVYSAALTADNKIKNKTVVKGYKPLHQNENWQELKNNKEILTLKQPKSATTLGEYLKFIAKFTGEDPVEIYKTYMQQEAKQVVAGIVQSVGSFRHRKPYNIIFKQEDGKTVVRNRVNTPIDATANNKAKIIQSLLDNFSKYSDKLDYLGSGKAPLNLLANYAGFNDSFINKYFSDNESKAILEHMSVVFKTSLKPLKEELDNMTFADLGREDEIYARAVTALQGDSAITKLAENIALLNGEFTMSSVFDAEGKQNYLYVPSSNAYDVLDALKQSDLQSKDINSLKSTKYTDAAFDYLTDTTVEVDGKKYNTFYSFNPFLHDIQNHKIYDVLDADGIVDQTFGNNRVIQYSSEKEPDYILRTFNAGFLNSLAVKGSPRYIQFLYTNSNRPTPLAVEIPVQSEKAIDQNIKRAVDQLVNKLELKYLEDTIDSYNRNPFLNMGAFESGIQKALNSSKKGKALLEEYRDTDSSIKEKSVIAEIKKAIVDKDLPYVKSLIEDNRLPLEDSLNKAITKLNEVNEVAIEKVADNFEYTPWVNERPSYNYPAQTDLVLRQFLLNNYVNNIFLNQLIIGDSTIYGDANGVVKRMSIATAPGQKGYASEQNGVPKEVDFLVAEDDVQEVLDEIFKGSKVEGTTYEATDAQMWFTDRFDTILKSMFGKKYGLSLVNKPVYHKGDNQGIVRTIKTSGLNLGFTEGMHKNTTLNLQELNKILNSHNIMGIVPKSANKSGSNVAKLGLQTRDWTVDEFNSLSEPAQEYLKEQGVSTINNNTLALAKGKPFYGELVTFRNTLKTGKFDIQTKTTENALAYDAYKFKLDTRFLRMQLNPAHDLNMSTSNPSQLQSFLGILVKPETEDNVNSIYNDYASLSKIYRRDLLGSIKTDDNFDNDKLTELIKDTLQAKGSERLADVISYIGIDHPSVYKKVQTQLSSIVEKRGLSTKFNGGKFTLISSHLFFNPKTGDRLKFIEDSKTGKRYAEVLAPAELFDESTQNKIKNGEEVLLHSEQLAFRIPSTELHSAVVLKVVGFHTTENNSLVLPQEIVPLHGSDYDVDALFLILKEKASSPIKIGELEISKGQPIGYNDSGRFLVNYDKTILDQKGDNVKENKKLDNLLKAYYKNRIMYNMLEVIQKEKIRMNNPISMDILKDPNTEGSMAQYLKNLNALAESGNLDLSSFRDNHTSYKSNMAGSALTGIMANNTKAIAVLTRAGEHSFNIEYLGKELNTFSNTQEVFDTLDALVNAAIDNVKEQILFKGNISIETGNVVASMVGLGLPMNEVFGLVAQPAIRLISNYGNTQKGKAQIRSLIYERLNELGVSNGDFNDAVENHVLIQSDLDEAIKNFPMGSTVNMSKMSTEDLVVQQKALNKFEEFSVVGNLLRDTSSALTILREAPINYADVKTKINTWNKIFGKSNLALIPVVENNTVTDVVPFPSAIDDNPILNLSEFFEKSPYIKEAIITIYNQKLISDQSILYNPRLNQFVESFDARNGKDIGMEVPVVFTLDAKQEKHEEALREQILRLALAQTFMDEVKNEVLEKISKKGQKYIIRKAAAFKERFAQEVKSVKDAYKNLPLDEQTNKFMHYLVAEYSTKRNAHIVTFRQPSNLQEADNLEIQDAFDAISDLNLPGIDLEKFKYDLVKYSALSTGMSFGLTGYSQFIPGQALVESAVKFKNSLDNISYNLDSLQFPIVMMLAKSKPEIFKSVRGKQLEREEANEKGYQKAKAGQAVLKNGNIAQYDILIPKINIDLEDAEKYDVLTEPTAIINYVSGKFNQPYILLGETDTGFAYRRLFPSTSIADFDLNVTDYLENPLQFESAFDPRVRELFTYTLEDEGAAIITRDAGIYKEGDIVTLTNSSDYFRENSVRVYIDSISPFEDMKRINVKYTKGTQNLNTAEKLDNFKKQFKVC